MKIRFVLFIAALSFGISSCNHLFYFPNSALYQTPKNLGLEFSPFFFKAGDEKLAAWKIKAVGGSPKASILHFHGNAQNMTAHFLFVSWLAYHDYDVYVFDYEGYGISTGVPSRSGTVADGLAFVEYVSKHSEGDLIVIGQSLGGAISVPVVAMANQQKIKALVIDSGFASYRRLAREKLSAFWLTWPLKWPLSFLVGDAYAAEDFAPKIKIPTLVIHGEADRVVSFSEGKKLFESFPENKRTLWKIPSGGHTSSLAANSSYREKLLIYLDGVLHKVVN